MKDIKSFLIGFLSCACMFLLMGATDSEQQVEDTKVVDALNDINSTLVANSKDGQGKYQAFGDASYQFIVDTHTGETWVDMFNPSGAWKKTIKPNQFYDSKKDFKNANK
tara:strand:- start:356 stop:682 length:327 start_codon:yes stop_codon:yes gene_type:complete